MGAAGGRAVIRVQDNGPGIPPALREAVFERFHQLEGGAERRFRILLDVKMPVMDGWQLAREFRARYDHRAPILVLTAAEDARKRAEAIGAVGWLGKPFDLDTLFDAVDRHMRVG